MKKPRQPRPKRTNDPQGTRRRVLDVASGAFQSRGYHSTSMYDITRAAEVTAGALHHHFPTKKALGLAVIRERVSQAVQDAWVEPVRTAPTAMDGILTVFQRIAVSLDARGMVLGCPLNNLVLELSLADPEFRDALKAIFDQWRSALAEKFRADEDAGALKAGVAENLAALVVASYSGAMALAKASQDSVPLNTCRDQLAAMMQTLRR